MIFNPYVLNENGDKVSAEINPMTEQDALITITEPIWQSNWTSSFINQSNFANYSLKVNGELIALACYEINDGFLAVHIQYIEAHPDSNPTIVGKNKKYSQIAMVLIAYGVKLSIDNGFAGDVLVEAKTTELVDYYSNVIKAWKLPASLHGGPVRFLIADERAGQLLDMYV